MTESTGRPTVMIVDDHEIVRAGLDVTLKSADGIAVLSVAANGREALDRLRVDVPDVLITDVKMPGMDGLELMSRAREIAPELTVLLLTVVEDPRSIREALDAGASGYLLKSSGAHEIVDAVHRALDGELVVSSGVGSIIAAQLLDTGHGELSGREVEVLTSVAAGNTNAQIARELFVSETTVRTHLRRSYTKLGVQDRTSAVAEAVRRGLVELA